MQNNMSKNPLDAKYTSGGFFYALTVNLATLPHGGVTS